LVQHDSEENNVEVPSGSAHPPWAEVYLSLVPKPLRQISSLPTRDNNLIQISDAIVATRASKFGRFKVNAPYWLVRLTSERSLSFCSCGDVESLQRHVYALRLILSHSFHSAVNAKLEGWFTDGAGTLALACRALFDP
jgi:hypothetical protein